VLAAVGPGVFFCVAGGGVGHPVYGALILAMSAIIGGCLGAVLPRKTDTAEPTTHQEDPVIAANRQARARRRRLTVEHLVSESYATSPSPILTLMNGIEVRPAVAQDKPFLDDMLVEAANWRGEPRRRADILSDPANARYTDGWPRETDTGVIATDDHGKPVGAAWLRFFTEADPAYGFVDAETPEVSLAVVATRRGQGIGRTLLRALATTAQSAGMNQLSLSVERANPAAALYRSEGYKVTTSGKHSDTMLLKLQPPQEPAPVVEHP
jgi:GNAT superfamily N-acetyltransferase